MAERERGWPGVWRVGGHRQRNCRPLIQFRLLSCRVYTYGNKDGRERDKLDDRGIAHFSVLQFYPYSIFMHGVHLRDQGGPGA